MGCVSSKLIKKELREETILANARPDCPNHVVSLTSSTYGVLKIDNEQERSAKEIAVDVEQQKNRSPPREEEEEEEEEELEEINSWELMGDLEEESPLTVQSKKSPKFLRKPLPELDAKTPLKFFNQLPSPKKVIKSAGKENRGGTSTGFGFSPKRVLKASNFPGSCPNPSPKLRFLSKGSPDSGKVQSRRKSLGPLFEPEQIKKMVSVTQSSKVLDLFENKCPPGGENSVVIYTTTLRGIRKTFEDCNVVRSIIDSHHIEMFERDVSMHSVFKEELRELMGATKRMRIPSVFVRGRMIGGAEEMVKMEEECKLGILFAGIPKAAAACKGCAGVRFVMCKECSGSCKVMDKDGKKKVKCGDCNENGLIQCPVCCC
ncbi:uncharacterized protein At3g28850 [Impatiens glandulifera]|uniref:uncharacterized protein At3g28850 n=1 Tax=Impatiens glandulifera TaxID=253017 RepID=UPI001FB083A3|nr:uncharacterized protein At3g28850 [Impatiens glandulifera]